MYYQSGLISSFPAKGFTAGEALKSWTEGRFEKLHWAGLDLFGMICISAENV